MAIAKGVGKALKGRVVKVEWISQRLSHGMRAIAQQLIKWTLQGSPGSKLVGLKC